jgi:hypothetical protein
MSRQEQIAQIFAVLAIDENKFRDEKDRLSDQKIKEGYVTSFKDEVEESLNEFPPAVKVALASQKTIENMATLYWFFRVKNYGITTLAYNPIELKTMLFNGLKQNVPKYKEYELTDFKNLYDSKISALDTSIITKMKSHADYYESLWTDEFPYLTLAFYLEPTYDEELETAILTLVNEEEQQHPQIIVNKYQTENKNTIVPLIKSNQKIEILKNLDKFYAQKLSQTNLKKPVKSNEDIKKQNLVNAITALYKRDLSPSVTEKNFENQVLELFQNLTIDKDRKPKEYDKETGRWHIIRKIEYVKTTTGFQPFYWIYWTPYKGMRGDPVTWRKIYVKEEDYKKYNINPAKLKKN